MQSGRRDLDIEMLAASLRADAADTGVFVEALAAKLEAVLPGRVRTERGRRGLFGPKQVRCISVDAGDQRLEVRRGDGDTLRFLRARLSGGIVLKTENLDGDRWLTAVGEALAGEAGRSEATRQALERLLTG